MTMTELQQPTENDQGFHGAAEISKATTLDSEPGKEQVTRQIDHLLSPSGRAELLDQTQAELNTPEMKSYAVYLEQKAELDRQYQTGQIDGPTQRDKDYDLWKELTKLYKDDRLAFKYSGLSDALERLRAGKVVVSEPSASKLLEDIIGTSANADATDRAHVFVDYDLLKPHEAEALAGSEVLELVTRDGNTRVPTGMFVTAMGLDSWEGRAPGSKKDGLPSKEVIKDYASRETTPPPLDHVSAYILPDGRVFFRSDSSHRTAAAILRGDPYIEVKGTVDVYKFAEIPKEL